MKIDNRQQTRKKRSSRQATNSAGFTRTNFSHTALHHSGGEGGYKRPPKQKRNWMESSGGFTLVELIVALGLFVAISFVAVGSLLAIADGNKKTSAIRAAMDNLNFALDTMARELRTGNNFDCGGTSVVGTDCPATSENGIGGGAGSIVFYDQDGVLTSYWWSGNEISVRRGTESTYKQLTSPEVAITKLKFFVSGTASLLKQPKITIVLEGRTGYGDPNGETVFNLQTTVSRRGIGTPEQ